MNEVQKPKKPLVFYYLIVLAVLLFINTLLVPWIAKQQIIEVDYSTFMTMTENKEIGGVQIEYNQILFTDKENTTVYKTGVLDDPNLVTRLHASGAEFRSEIIEEASPLLSFLISWILPMVFFIIIGQFLSRRMMSSHLLFYLLLKMNLRIDHIRQF